MQASAQESAPEVYSVFPCCHRTSHRGAGWRVSTTLQSSFSSGDAIHDSSSGTFATKSAHKTRDDRKPR